MNSEDNKSEEQQGGNEAAEAEAPAAKQGRGRQAAKAEAPAAKKPSKRYMVTINPGEGEGEKGEVVLAHNFKQVQIQRGVAVPLSEEFINVLRDAVVQTVVGEGDDKQPLRIPRYSFSVEPMES